MYYDSNTIVFLNVTDKSLIYEVPKIENIFIFVKIKCQRVVKNYTKTHRCI